MGTRSAWSLKALAQRDERLTNALHGFAISRFGNRWAEEAIKVYLPPVEPGAEHLALFLAWALHHWRTEDGSTVNEAYLARWGASLSLEDRAWLRSQAAARFSFWEVHDRLPTVGVRVKDLLGDETRFIHEENYSHWFPLRSTWLARVVEHEGVSLYRGLHAGYLCQPEVEEMVRATRQALQGSSSRDEQVLRVIQMWTGYYTGAVNPQPC
jgi:hypothetical protein